MCHCYPFCRTQYMIKGEQTQVKRSTKGAQPKGLAQSEIPAKAAQGKRLNQLDNFSLVNP